MAKNAETTANTALSSEGITVNGDMPREHANEVINAVLVNDQGVSEDEAQRISDEVTDREYGSDQSGSAGIEPTD